VSTFTPATVAAANLRRAATSVTDTIRTVGVTPGLAFNACCVTLLMYTVLLSVAAVRPGRKDVKATENVVGSRGGLRDRQAARKEGQGNQRPSSTGSRSVRQWAQLVNVKMASHKRTGMHTMQAACKTYLRGGGGAFLGPLSTGGCKRLGGGGAGQGGSSATLAAATATSLARTATASSVG